MLIYACLRVYFMLTQRARTVKALTWVFTHVHAVYDTFTYGLRMFTENISHDPSLYAAGQIQKQKLQRLFLGVRNEYTSSLSVHVDRTMIRVHSGAVLNLQLLSGGWLPVNRFALLFRASVTDNDDESA